MQRREPVWKDLHSEGKGHVFPTFAENHAVKNITKKHGLWNRLSRADLFIFKSALFS